MLKTYLISNFCVLRARPLKKLCEFEGEPLPEDYKSDCYQDVDESDYACKEKYRIMVRRQKWDLLIAGKVWSLIIFFTETAEKIIRGIKKNRAFLTLIKL